MKFSKNTLPPILAAQYKEKIVDYVARVKRAEFAEAGILTTHVRIDFLDGTKGLWTYKNGQSDFAHYCEAFAGKRPCPHLGCAVAIADISAMRVDRFTRPNDPDDLQALIAAVPASDFMDVSEGYGIPAIPEEDEPPVSIPATPAPAAPPAPTAPVKSKRDWRQGWAEVETYLLGQGIDRRLLVRVLDKRKVVCDLTVSTPMSI